MWNAYIIKLEFIVNCFVCFWCHYSSVIWVTNSVQHFWHLLAENLEKNSQQLRRKKFNFVIFGIKIFFEASQSLFIGVELKSFHLKALFGKKLIKFTLRINFWIFNIFKAQKFHQKHAQNDKWKAAKWTIENHHRVKHHVFILKAVPLYVQLYHKSPQMDSKCDRNPELVSWRLFRKF